MTVHRSITTDVLVVGAGLAGLVFALEMAKKHNVTLLAKDALSESNTRYAQGGIAAVVSSSDSFDTHLQNTIDVGSGLTDAALAKKIVETAPEAIHYLEKQGIAFDKKGEDYELGREAGHSGRRIVHINDNTGKTIQDVLTKNVIEHEKIRCMSHTMVIDLVIEKGTCIGAWILDRNDNLLLIHAKIVMLATGGAGYLYAYTSNPSIASADGIAMAYRAGAIISDVEFVQFHPTALCNPGGQQQFLLTETLRGEGGKIVNEQGERFLKNYHQDVEMAPRDIVSRAIMEEGTKTPVYLDLRELDTELIKKRFITIYRTMMNQGINCIEERIPICSVAHYMCGGVRVDEHGATNIKHLFVSGESTASYLHGANRLASNSLLEAITLSLFAAKQCLKHALPELGKVTTELKFDKKRSFDIKNIQAVRTLMWENVGIIRNEEKLQHALDVLSDLSIDEIYPQRDYLKFRNMVQVSRLIAYSALMRKESRGTHYREDFPQQNATWEKHINLQKLRV